VKFSLQTDRAYYESVNESHRRVYVWASRFAAEKARAINEQDEELFENYPAARDSSDLPSYMRAELQYNALVQPKPLAEFGTYDPSTGASTADTQEDFERACHEWEAALDEDEFQKYFENN
jgi:hypothetical protein